jgi:hypothetical protein
MKLNKHEETIMNSYREYYELATASLNRAAKTSSPNDREGERQIAIASAHVYALLAIAEAIRGASGQTD